MENIIVRASGVLVWNGKEYRCALGKGGISENKKEGDGATPAGTFPLCEVYYRADRVSKINAALPTHILNENNGWCDDISDLNYNRHVKLPYAASHENLWREDHLYDIIVVVGYNDDPPIPGKGSAIFIHIARPEFTPTDGCIALAQEDLIEILGSADSKTMVLIKN